ncbi:MAG: leucine-rich repeat domain-containing protein, partial [Bacteroidia bacterium]
AELGHLKNLQVLNIYDNKVKMLPPEMQELTNITDLYLSQNRLIEVPAWIGGMGRLKNLDVSFNRIINLEGERLQRALPKCKVTH